MAKMIKCKTCGADIASSAKSCPSCGAKNKKPFFKKVWFWVLIVIIIGAAGAGASNDTKEGNDKKTDVTTEKKEKYELVGETTWTKDALGIHIEGTVKNNAGKEVTYAQITFKLFDADGNQVGTAIDNINNLEKDGTWKFKAIGIDTDNVVTSYKLSEVTGF